MSQKSKINQSGHFLHREIYDPLDAQDVVILLQISVSLLSVLKNICISMQKTHPNFINKEQLMASPFPVGCGSHVTPHEAGLPLGPAFPLFSTIPPTPSYNSTMQLWLLLKQKYIKNKTPKTQNCSLFLPPHLKENTLELEKA